MDSRGRSRNMSPIALVRASLEQHKLHTEISVNVTFSSNLDDPAHAGAAEATRHAHHLGSEFDDLFEELPVASSSRLVLEPPPQLSSSHSSSASSSLEQTPAPTTPPMYGDDAYPIRYDVDPLAYYDSPPSPPRTLQDQMQVAYALDNMHLAKVLLLKLKGIEVTDDHDPRIAAVKDEDFSETFVPRGGLQMTEEAERRCREGQRREQERRRRFAREERLKVCERIWENGRRSYQEAKARAARRKEADTRVRRLADLEARERDRERTREREAAHDNVSTKYRRGMRTTCGVPRPILSYDALPASHTRQMSTSRSPPKRDDDVAYEYTLMRPMVTTAVSTSPRPSAAPNSAYRELAAMSSTSVPFSDVMSSMHGALFPEEDTTRRRQGKSLSEIKLLETLLESTPWELRDREETRPTKGKDKAGVEANCIACAHEFNLQCEVPSSSSVSSSTSTAVTRSISWFSFGSRSSVSTTLTTPSSSPMSVKVFQPLQPAGRGASRLPASSAKHSCRRPRAHRSIPVPLASSENPLSVPANTNSAASDALLKEQARLGRGRLMGRGTNATLFRASSTDSTMLATGTAIVERMSRSVSTFIDMAAQLQRAYVKATMYTASPDIYFSSPDHPRSRSRSNSRTRSRARSVAGGGRRRDKSSLRPQGYRASSDDVLTFTSTDLSLVAPTPERPLIPLANTRPASLSAPDMPRVFPAPAPVPRSPFRPAQPPSCLTSRLRPIANPLLLRLRALQNVYGGLERDVLEVREKVVGVAWEGIGRSSLVWEVKPVSH
ncbi:hypothetical protein BDW22DRAFT_1350279 [Trametopsis cervina]|nr:hypothetical protein BDW22DRAFT_1350279 [Trametopsis cervina]